MPNQSFKYPFVHLGDMTAFALRIRSGLTLIETFNVGTWIDSSNETNDIEALVYVDHSHKGYGSNLYVVFLDYTNYMFTFDFMEDVIDCINDFRSKDVDDIVDRQNEARSEHISKIENGNGITLPVYSNRRNVKAKDKRLKS